MARLRWSVLATAIVAVTAAGVWGLGVFGQLSEGGYNDPGAESSRAADAVRQELGARGGDLIAVYRPLTGTIDDAALGKRIEAKLGSLPRSAVSQTDGYWPGHNKQYASADGRSAVAVITLAGEDDGAKLSSYRDISDSLGVPGTSLQLAGGAPLQDASASRSTDDLAFAEAISLPIVLVLLLFIFGSLVAASLPVLVGGCAVLGSLGVLHAIAAHHDVNSFAVNVASLLGLGMAIDYGLFMVGRFREELEAGHAPAEAVSRTVATAGRTVLFSASLLMIALAGLLLFPQGFLKSLAYGGLAAVALAALLSLTLLPALLAVLGPRINKLPVRLPRRNRSSMWAKLAGVVLRRPVLIALPILAGLLVLAAPVRGVHFGENDERVLPAGDPARQAIETLKTDFPALSSSGVLVVLHGEHGAAPSTSGAAAFEARIAKVPGVTAVTPAGTGGAVVTWTATLTATDPFSDTARDAVHAIRDLRPPLDAELLVGGTTARNIDSLTAIGDRLPLMVALLAGATLILMFLAFGSVLLPIKAVLMSALSLSATFGILVWIFQDGHGAGLLKVTPAPLEAGIVVLMAAVVFGLSTDYEVFLLSRMVEARTHGATTAEAITTGLSRTGRVISAAALLLIVVTGAFALSSVTTMRFVGIGMITALFLDATVVRMLLVPAVLKLMGDAAWWAPGPLKRLQQRAGLAETDLPNSAPGLSTPGPSTPGRSTPAVSAGPVLSAPAVSAGPAVSAAPAVSGGPAHATPALSGGRHAAPTSATAGLTPSFQPATPLPARPSWDYSPHPTGPSSGLPIAGSAPSPGFPHPTSGLPAIGFAPTPDFPHRASGLPTANTGLPGAGSGLPCAGNGPSTPGSGPSAPGSGLPSAGSGPSTPRSGLPSAGSGLPRAGSDLPSAGSAPMPQMPFAGSAPQPRTPRVVLDQQPPDGPRQLDAPPARWALPPGPDTAVPPGNDTTRELGRIRGDETDSSVVFRLPGMAGPGPRPDPAS
ncbi:MMPL family transporter [Winogradskya humida]|uniref:MMPL family transporter n=1 Tax=Winogradskya humida TaxID=113566 RepID=UPI001940DD3A|nr:MMPL family transporter [Actinoplanes humidus]